MTSTQTTVAKKRAYLSYDPGAKGSLCLLVPETKHVEFYPVNGKPIDIANWLQQVKTEYEIRIILGEDVHSIYGVSAKSNFNFGRNVGIVYALCCATGLGLDLIAPKKWQAKIGVKKKGKLIKKEVGDIAERLYPNVNIRGARGGLLDGKADSLMICHVAYLTYNLA